MLSQPLSRRPRLQLKILFHSTSSRRTNKASCSDLLFRVKLKLHMRYAHDHATAPTQPTQSSEMAVPGREQPSIKPANRGTITSKRAGSQTHKHKQNIPYVLKSGLAGGLAGCAVRFFYVVCLYLRANNSYRPKQSLVPSTASRSFSKPLAPNLQSTRAPGSAL